MKAAQISMDLAVSAKETAPAEMNVFRRNDISAEQKTMIRRHRQWLDQFQKEYPLPSHPYRIFRQQMPIMQLTSIIKCSMAV
jgi:hypothetical protein